MRAMVFGAKGTLGQALVAQLPAAGIEVVGAYGHQDCDITDEKMVRSLVESNTADVVFNAGAYTDVDGAESNGDQAYLANAIGPEVLARACSDALVRLVHYSTDFVFDGELE